MLHYLKTWPQYFYRVIEGEKRFEVRKNDRDFQTGDCLSLEEYDPETKQYTGRRLVCNVDYILFGPNFGIQEGYCVMSITVSESYSKI